MPFVDLTLARRLEMTHAWRSIHYARAQQKLQPDIESTIEDIAGGYVIYAGAGAPQNRAVGLGLYRPIEEDDLDFVEAFYESCAMAPRIDVCPVGDGSLLERLQERDYQLESFYNVLVLDLDDEEFDVPPLYVKRKRRAKSPEVHISVADVEDSELWLRTVAAGFTEEEPPPDKEIEELAPNFFSSNATCFFAWLLDEPAGGGAMYEFDGAVELGGTSTRVSFRRRGVQTALLNARLAAAQELGCDLAMSVTRPGSDSQRNMEKVGFQLAYTKAIMIKLD